MTTHNTVDEILDFAITREQEAQAFYRELSERAATKSAAKLFKDFAAMEKGHEAKLKAVKQGKKLMSAAAKVQDLKIADYMAVAEPSGSLDYQGALSVAMQREKAAFKLYCDLAASTEDAALKETFMELANEEAAHKLSIELEYDEHILTEN
jgi:rubrerythrin